jgi:hypothetical protein
MDLVGLAAVITALTGTASLVITVYLILRVEHVSRATQQIHDLTNSNFSKMQKLLEKAVETANESGERDRARHKLEDDRRERQRRDY